MKPILLLLLTVFSFLPLSAQQLADLPVWDDRASVFPGDWLIDGKGAVAALYRKADGSLVLSNGIVSRTFAVEPGCATVAMDLVSGNVSFVRSVRPEAEVTVDGLRLAVGGLTGQPVQNYLSEEWQKNLLRDEAAFTLTGWTSNPVRERFAWKRRPEWMTTDLPWPAPGLELVFSYAINEKAIGLACTRSGKSGAAPLWLAGITVDVHYELYDGMPLFCKWITVRNGSGREVTVDSFKSEILAMVEAESVVDSKTKWILPNITVETDYNFGGMTDESITRTSIAWSVDTLYKTQVNYEMKTPCLLEAYPKYGPAQKVADGETFESFRTWELLHDSRDRERRGLEHRRMMRATAPWSAENPVLMHVRNAGEKDVRKAIDQCAAVGFEMVIMTFGSGFNVENDSRSNIEKMKSMAEYAHSKGIALGGYSLLASRQVGGGNDVVMPEGMKPAFGNSPCLESEWGINYFRQLYSFYEETGLDVLEHDGSYPGDVCASDSHPGHKGLGDSQWNQYRRITDFYKWCRARGIYLNVPDYYFLSGSNKTGMGYRETNWSLPREQQEIIERQNIYDGTWEKTPSMGWMFVPLVEYHGGGAAATIEPLKDHLQHYGQRLANLFGAGVQACYRGPQLYDAPETEALVSKWVSFYKKHRRILDGDIIHVRRPDGRDFDAILHVDPTGEEKGLLMVYNPLNEEITRTIEVPVYYTGLADRITVQEQDGPATVHDVSRNYTVTLTVSVPAKGYNYFVMKK